MIGKSKCIKCGKVRQNHGKGVCNWCYRRYFWKRKEKICPRCKRKKPVHARGLCSGCYNTTFFLQQTKDRNNTLRHNIPPQLYKKITKSCIVCNFNKFVELHHIDCNRQNNSEDNMVGLCPNHHKMLHTIEYGEWLKELIERLVTLRKYQTTLTFTQTPDNQTNNPIEIPIKNKLNMATAC